MYIMYLYGANRSTQKSFSLAYVLFIIAAALGVSHIGPPRYDKLGIYTNAILQKGSVAGTQP